MANDNWTPGGEEPIDILDDDLLEETELSLDDDEGGFEEESTQIYQPGEHDDGGFEEEATRVFDPSDDQPEEFEDESTRVWQHEPDPAPAPMRHPTPAPAAGAYTTQLPRHGVTNLASAARAAGQAAEQSTVITDSAALYPDQARKQVARPSAGASGQTPRQAGEDRQSKVLTAMIALAAVALLSAMAAIFFRPGPAPTGTVAVLTTPVGAAVVLDGERLTLTTPTTLSDLEVGRTYSLQLELDGFEHVTDTLVVAEGLSQRIFELEAATGSVVVRTVPEGASVTVDGTIRGTSPVTVEGLDPTKPHQIVATIAGHEDATRSVTFTAGGSREELVTMTLTPAAGAAVAAGTPPATDPAVAAAAAGTAPAAGVPAAGSTVTVGPDGTLVGPDGQPILGPDGQPLTVLAAATPPEAEAEPEPEPEPEPAAASSSRSGESSRSSRSSRSGDSARTSRSSRSSRSGETSRSASSRDRPSSRSSRSGPPSRERPSAARPAEPEPEPEPAGDGSLSVQAVPYGQVWIDGRMVSPETPLIGHELSAGVHRVKVYFVGMRSFSDERSVRIEAGQNRTVTFRAER